jgi:MHS family proline/betaine transporter-like MFS transporter
VVLAIPLFALIGQGNTAVAVVCLILLGQFEGAYLGVISSAYCEMFPASVRATGFSLGFNLSSIVAGGTAPYIATWLIDQTDDDKSPAYLLVAAGVLSLIGVFRMRETAGKPLPLD